MLRGLMILCICPARYDALLKAALAGSFFLVTWQLADVYCRYTEAEFHSTLWMTVMAFSGMTAACFFSAWQDLREFWVRRPRNLPVRVAAESRWTQ